MIQAIEAVRSSRIGINKAVRAHTVPSATLKDKLSGSVKHESLAKFLVKCSENWQGQGEVISMSREHFLRRKEA